MCVGNAVFDGNSCEQQVKCTLTEKTQVMQRLHALLSLLVLGCTPEQQYASQINLEWQ